VKTWDVIIVGGGIIGVSVALGLRKRGAQVLIVEKSEPGGEATHAAAGMLAHCEQAPPLRDLALASAAMYPEFLHEIEDESGYKVDYRRHGTIVFLTGDEEEPLCKGGYRLDAPELARLEPRLSCPEAGAAFLPEASVEPRALIAAAVKAAHHRGVDIASGTAVTQIEITNLGVSGVSTTKTNYPGAIVVNCAGAWSGHLAGPLRIPTRPLKGHMMALIPASRLTVHGIKHSTEEIIRHVVRGPDAYLVPRTDGRIVVGSTVEDVGYDKRVVPDTIQRLHQAAANLVPELGEARIHETWAGLRPGSPDALPLIGATDVQGYFVATGHFRDGILLAPITAHLMTQLIMGEQPDFDLSAFSPQRFS
jgi:glycine oxidase